MKTHFTSMYGLANNNNNDIEDIGVLNKHDGRHNHVGVPDDNLQQQNQHFGRREQHDSVVDNKDDYNNSHVNLVGNEESSTNNNNKKSHDSQQHDSDSYFNSNKLKK